MGLPWWLSGKDYACQCRRHRFNSWFGKTPHAEKQLSLCTTTIGPVLYSWGTATAEAHAPLEPVFHRKRSHNNEKPAHRDRRAEFLISVNRESTCSPTKTQWKQKINKIIDKKKRALCSKKNLLQISNKKIIHYLPCWIFTSWRFVIQKSPLFVRSSI